MQWRALLAAACVAVCQWCAAALPLRVAEAPGALSLHDTVRSYLETGGHELMREHMDLQPGVVYNPLMHMSVDHAHERYGGEAMSDLSVLRLMGLHVPGVDAEAAVASGDALRAVTSVRQYKEPVVGSMSSYEVSFFGRPPEQARQAFRYALRIWSDTFPCDITLRVRFDWKTDGSARTLAAAVSPFSIVGGRDLQDDASYTPTMTAAVSGQDRIPGKFHIILSFNSAQDWHFITDRVAPFRKYDFVTVALHELCHGLYFTGALLANPPKGVAIYQSIDRFPARFDQFIQMSNGIGIARSCDERELYQAITRRGLSFRTSDVPSTFTLYAPPEYKPGSSTYHLDNLSLKPTCRRFNISDEDCSDLMTFELDPGYTQHKVGEQALRVMRSVLSQSPGLIGSDRCTVPAALANPESTSLGELGNIVTIGPFRVQRWVIIVACAVAAVGAALILFFIATAVCRRR